MYKNRLLPLIFLLLPLSIFAQWQWLNPLPQGNNLTAVQFTDDLNGYMAGDYGTIMKTTDGGISWQVIYIGETWNLVSISFVSTDVGYACGGDSDGYVYKTTDAGLHWTRVATIPYAMPNSIWFTSEQTGILCGWWASVYRTTDGGTTWTHINGINDDCWSVYFTDSLTGYIGGDKKIYKTVNGGSSWFTSYNGQFNTAQVCSIHFISPDTGFAAGNFGTFLRTTDGGLSWDRPIGSSNQSFTGVRFLNANVGFMVGADGLIMNTTNGGYNWVQIPSYGNEHLMGISFANASTGIIAGWHGKILRTTDLGSSWNLNSSYVALNNLYCVTFSTPQHGYCVGDSGIILKTMDAGLNWTPYFTASHHALRYVCFTDDNTGYVCGDNGDALKTDDAGLSWFPLNIPTSYGFRKILFPTPDTGYLYEGHNLKKTINAGVTWGDIHVLSANDLFFLNADTGFFCANNGKFWITTDGGVTITAIPTNSTKNFYSVYFLNSSTGFLGGIGFIQKTTDGGMTWSDCPIAGNTYQDYVGSFTFSDPLNGFAIGKYCQYTSSDGGETWTNTYIIPFSHFKHSAFFTSPDTGYVVGDNGLIMKTVCGGVITAAPKIPAVKHLVLYPNPNQGTFKVNNPAYPKAARFSIHSLYGRCIYNGLIPAGEPASRIAISGVEPGVYILKILSGGQMRVEKFIVE